MPANCLRWCAFGPWKHWELDQSPRHTAALFIRATRRIIAFRTQSSWKKVILIRSLRLSHTASRSCAATFYTALWGTLINIACAGLGSGITNVREGGSRAARWRRIVCVQRSTCFCRAQHNASFTQASSVTNEMKLFQSQDLQTGLFYTRFKKNKNLHMILA